MDDALLRLCPIRILHKQVDAVLSIRGKDQPRGIWSPRAGAESKPLGASALRVISPDINALASNVRLLDSHRSSVRSQGYVAIDTRLANRTQFSPIAIEPQRL